MGCWRERQALKTAHVFAITLNAPVASYGAEGLEFDGLYEGSFRPNLTQEQSTLGTVLKNAPQL